MDKQNLMQQEAWLLRDKYNGEETREFTTDCLRLQRGEPLAYVIGHIPFLNCTIYLDSYPLIPRPETEFWVEKAIAEITSNLSKDRPLHTFKGRSFVKVLDLCAGSGCVGVAVAKAIPEAHVTIAEIEAKHLPTIEKNLESNIIIYDSEKYQVIESDLFSNIDGEFDFILSNPPYIDPTLNRVADSVKNFEPELALYGGQGGLELIEKILVEVKNYLEPDGQLYLEHEPEQARAIHHLAEALGLKVETHTDQYQLARYSVFSVAQ